MMDKRRVYFGVLVFVYSCVFYCNGRIHTSSPRFSEYFKLENQIVEGLGRYVDHETERLVVIRNRTGYEDEVPLVEERLEILKSVHEEAQVNASAISEDMKLLRAHHPTSSYIAIKNFNANWSPLIRNQTLYGFRLLEFLNVSSQQVFNSADLHNIKNDIVYTHLFYNLSASDIYRGDILGVKGEPLTIVDAYDIGRHAKASRKLRVALQWFELVLQESKRVNNETEIDMAMLLSELAILHANFGDLELADVIANEAYALNDTDSVVHRRFLQVVNENLQPLPNFDDIAPIYWKNFTELCQAKTTYQGPMQWYHRCRMRCSPNPLRRYREEILSISPYVSVFYDIIDDDTIEEIKTESAGNLTDINSVYYSYLHGTVLDVRHSVEAHLTHLAADISGLKTTFKSSNVQYWNSATAFEVLKFGFSGRAIPHTHTSMEGRFMSGAGSKIAAVSFYLSDVEKGGATVFLDIGLRYQPKKGSALLMFYKKPSGEYDTRLTKAECAHALGEKWIVQKEIYDRYNKKFRPCAKKELGNQIGLDRMVHKFRHCGF